MIDTNRKLRIGGALVGEYKYGTPFTIGQVLIVGGNYFFNALETNRSVYLQGAQSHCLATVKGTVPYVKTAKGDLYVYHRRYGKWLKNKPLNKYFKDSEFNGRK